MYVQIKKVLADASFKEPNVTMYRLIRMDFPPTPGLIIFEDEWQETVGKVAYDTVNGRYVAMPARCNVEFPRAIQEHIDMGWSTEPGR